MLVNSHLLGHAKAHGGAAWSRLLHRSMGVVAAVIATTLLPAAHVQAQITYVDATSANTVQAAIVDGCSLLGAFVRVILPVSLPGILTTVIFTFTLTMQEFIYALTFISTESQVPVTLGVATDLVRGDIFYWGSLMAAALIASLPFAVLYNLFLDRFIMGITGGALK